MRLFVAIFLGVLSGFALSILGVLLLFGRWMPEGLQSLFPEFPVIALFVGALTGLIARDRARLAAALSLTPWAIWLILATNESQSAPWRWATTIAIASALLGIGAAALVRRHKVVLLAALAGAVVGISWMFAIHAALNGAQWLPNSRSWPAYITCPFTRLVGVSDLANLLVPVLNGLYYSLVAWCFLRVRRRWSSSSS